MTAHPNQSSRIPNRSMPPGKIIPELVYNDLGKAVTWLCQAFGFRERLRIGNHRAQLLLGNVSFVAIGSSIPPGSLEATDNPIRQKGDTDHAVMLHLDNVDRQFEVAVHCGAKIISPPEDYPYGERQCTLEDIGGHRWKLSQTIADVDPQDWGGVLLPGDDDAI